MTEYHEATIVEIRPASWSSGGLRVAVLDAAGRLPDAPLALRIPKGGRGYRVGKRVRYRTEDGVTLERTRFDGASLESVQVPGTSYYLEGLAPDITTEED